MPRIPNPIIIQAYKYHALLPLLLRECRSLNSAKKELRWLRDHALGVTKLKSTQTIARSRYPFLGWRTLLKSMCWIRSKGMPLQYILGDQPFGSLDIICKRGVLIPRHETETITLHAAKLVLDGVRKQQPTISMNNQTPLRILDLCTGTGCISLLLHSLLSPHFKHISIVGIDISRAAIALAKRNTEYNVRRALLSSSALSEISFRWGNVLGPVDDDIPGVEDVLCNSSEFVTSLGPRCDVLISNPPYISPQNFRDGTTTRSVRIFEPELALVPPSDTGSPAAKFDRHGDLFYHHITKLLVKLQPKLTILECGDLFQALRVADICRAIAQGCPETDRFSITTWPVTNIETDPCAIIIRRDS